MKKNMKLILGAAGVVCAVGIAGAAIHFTRGETPSSSLSASDATPTPPALAQNDPASPQTSPAVMPEASAVPQASPAVTPEASASPQASPAVTPEASAAPQTTPAAPTASPEPASAVLVQNPAAYPSANLTDMLGAENLAVLQAAGVIAKEPEKIALRSADSSEGIQLEKVETFQGSFVLVTLNAGLSSIDTSDIAVKKYSDNWYSLAPSTAELKAADVAYTLNDEGETVFLYQLDAEIDGTRIIPDYSSKQFGNLEREKKTADNYISWQMSNGGWDKGVDKQAAREWNGTEAKNKSSGWTSKDGQYIGTIDNDATYTQMRQIAAVYRQAPEEKYRESFLKGLDFIFDLQYESGGFAQVYPRRGNYSDYVTFNDEAMINVMIMLEDMRDRAYPFDSDLIPEDYYEKIEDSIARGIDFIIKSQITSQGKLTAWCAQHDPVTYEPMGGRAYELPSISGSESVAVVKFLIHQPEQTEEIKNAVNCALEWFRESEVKGLRFDKDDLNKEYFIKDEKSSLWYRFYEIDTNRGMFCDRDGIVKYNITEIGSERRNGYSWSGSWPKKLLDVYEQYGFYENLIEVSVVKTDSASSDGSTLQKDSARTADGEIIVE